MNAFQYPRETEKAKPSSADISGKDSSDEKPHSDLSHVSEFIEELDIQLQAFDTRLAFSYDKESKKTIVQVLDRNTGEIIKQIPPEEILKAQSKVSSILGLLVDKMM